MVVGTGGLFTRPLSPSIAARTLGSDCGEMDSETVEKLMRLSALELDEDARVRLVRDLGRIVALIDEMQSVDTEGVAPLAHPLDAVQPLRPDRADPNVDRTTLQRGAPATRDGLYLVPRVVE